MIAHLRNVAFIILKKKLRFLDYQASVPKKGLGYIMPFDADSKMMDSQQDEIIIFLLLLGSVNEQFKTRITQKTVI